MSKVMLIEDDKTMLSLLTTLLEIEGFSVVEMEEEQPDVIINQLKTEQQDVVLMDVHLAQLNGMDMLKMIKQDEQVKSVKVLMSSGMDFHYDCIRAGASGFIMKPYMPDELLSHLRQIINI